MYNPELLKAVDDLINASPERQRKLHILGYDDPEYVEKKLKEIERENRPEEPPKESEKDVCALPNLR